MKEVNMEHFDEMIVGMTNREAQERKKIREWDEQLAEIVEEIPQLKVTQNGLDTEMKEYVMFDGEFRIFMPDDFIKMNTEDIKQKYPSESRPQFVYRNKKDTVNIGFTIISENISDKEVSEVRDMLKNVYLSENPASDVMDEGNFNQNRNTVAYYAYLNFAVGGQTYNLGFITPLADRLLICRLSCLKKDMEANKLLFYGIMKTVKSERRE